MDNMAEMKTRIVPDWIGLPSKFMEVTYWGFPNVGWPWHDKKKTLLQGPFRYCTNGQESGISCSLVYSYLKIHKLTTSEKDFSTAGFFTAFFFGCLFAGISSDFLTVAFIKNDLRLIIICRHDRPSQKFQLKRKRNK
jgi:hypothetical protein